MDGIGAGSVDKAMGDFSDNLKPAQPRGADSLAKERARSDIPVEELTVHLLSRDGVLERQQRVLKPMLEEPLLVKSKQLSLSRPERFKLGLARAKLLRRLAVKHGWSYEDHIMADSLVDEMAPYALQLSMFNTTIREQASDEQQKHWIPLIEQWKVVGAYGQSELGHGSNVRGLETQAFYDVATRQFIIHSPTLTASKWWNGSLGKTATHTILVAQLMLPDSSSPSGYKSYGPHSFVVQVRDRKTHKTLPDILVGDIGPKVGYPAIDNAYLLFNKHRVPHSALLARYTKVDPSTGAYTKPENQAVVYGSMTNIRTRLVLQSRMILARAVTIAVRYCAVRHQFVDRDARGSAAAVERAVLDYPTVQLRLLPLVAATYALHYTGISMSALYRRTRSAIASKGDFSAMADLHATSSALKSMTTEISANGIETCRRACGGHGFGGYSGFIGLNSDWLSKVTVEGDNHMITQQTAAYLIKKVDAVVARLDRAGWEAPRAGAPADDTERAIQTYLLLERAGARVQAGLPVLRSAGALVAAFERRAAAAAVRVWRERVAARRPWTDMMIGLHDASNAHAAMLLVRNFHAALGALFRLFALTEVQRGAAAFLGTRPACVTPAQMAEVAREVERLMREDVRPHAVALVDAWAVPEYVLNSALGAADGRVYERMFAFAHKQNDEMNGWTANPWFWDEEVVMGEGPYRAPWQKGGAKL